MGKISLIFFNCRFLIIFLSVLYCLTTNKDSMKYYIYGLTFRFKI